MLPLTKMTSTSTTTMPTITAPAINWTDAVVFKEPKDICENCCEERGVPDEDGDICTCDICEGCGDDVGWSNIIVHEFGYIGLCITCSLKDGPQCPRKGVGRTDPCEFCVAAYEHEDEEHAQIEREMAQKERCDDESEEHEDDCTCNECEDEYTNVGEKAMK